MKYTLLFLLLPVFGNAQKLVENTKDEFTGAIVKRTQWEQFSGKVKHFSYIRASRIDNNFYIGYKLSMNNQVFGISQGAKLMIKLADSTIITATAVENKVTCGGCGAINILGGTGPGMNIEYSIPGDKFLELLKSKAVKIRLYTSDGYTEADIKEGNAADFIKQAELLIK